ncbi:MAG TPA: hypothetical protein P5539_14250 [Mesotoga sp.]|nr:hypothetical protein [Mesotoga sp.]
MKERDDMSRFGILKLPSYEESRVKEIDVIIPHITAITTVKEESGAFCFELIGASRYAVCFSTKKEAVELRENMLDTISDFMRALATGKLCDTLPKTILDDLRGKA